MTELDPARFPMVKLADPAHRLPIPGSARFLDPAGERVDLSDPFWSRCLADGSVVPVAPPTAQVEPFPAAAPPAEPAHAG